MNRADAALLAYGKADIIRLCTEQTFDFREHYLCWGELEARARRSCPGARWFRRLVLVEMLGNEPELDPVVLGFETIPTVEEFNEKVRAYAERMGYADKNGPQLLFDALDESLTDLEAILDRPEPMPPGHEGETGRPRRFLNTARAMLRRAGNETVPHRRRRLAAAA
jgi:hypothetical protein